MLVLARRLHERIILPALDITIQVVALQGNMVRLGIEAPREVGVYREEVYDPTLALPPADEPPALVGHNIRNRLNNLGISVALLQRQLSTTSLPPDARQTLEQVHAQVVTLKDQVQALLGRPAQLTS
jgi:carbon storage regulator CsrA